MSTPATLMAQARLFGLMVIAALLAALILAFVPGPAHAADIAARRAATPAGVPAPEHAIVLAETLPLRTAARDSSAALAQLAQGDLLEVRGTRLDHLQVYDHRRERAGYVRADAVRRLVLVEDERGADEMLVLARHLRQRPGQEALGIAFVAAHLKMAAPGRIGAEPFDLLGTMAERMARRAVAGLAAADTVAAYGVRFASFEREGRLQLCYDGEAFRRVLSFVKAGAAQAPAAAPVLGGADAVASAEQRARAALALTRQDCVDPAMPPLQRARFDQWRAELLDDASAAAAVTELTALTKARLHLRRAGVWAARAYQLARQGEPTTMAGQRALAELAAAERAELADEDLAEYHEAAMRVGASRFAVLPMGAAPASGKLRVALQAGAEPGQTCVALLEAGAGDAGAREVLRRCTFGVVWPGSVQVRPAGDAVVIAVQPLEGWTELWLLRARADEGWRADVLPPAALNPGIGYVEFAGWAPASAGSAARLLVAREARAEGRSIKRFEVVSLESLDVLKQASTPALLAAFGQHGEPQWRRRSVALR